MTDGSYFWQWTVQERGQCVTWFSECKSVITVQRRFRRIYKKEPPSGRTIRSWFTRFQETGSLEKAKSTGRPRISEKDVERIRLSYVRNPEKSIRNRSWELGIPMSTVRRVLRERLGLQAYKIQLVDECGDTNPLTRAEFANLVCEKESSKQASRAKPNKVEEKPPSPASVEELTKAVKEPKSRRKRKTEVKTTKQSKKSKSEDAVEANNIVPGETTDFTSDAKSPSGKKWNLKISSWNINGVRAWLDKGLGYLKQENPDIFCIQETKCDEANIPSQIKKVDGYHSYWLSGDQQGYSGVGVLTKEKPLNVTYGIGVKEHDKEGRVITAEYEKFYLVNVYVPNAGRGLVRLDYRMKWDKDFHEYLNKLDSKKPVILCGDLNVAHNEIDLARPKSNTKNAGFTKEERESFTELLEQGYMDSFRKLYPEKEGCYTFWTYMMNARGKDIGWRLDYFVLSDQLESNLCDSLIRKHVRGSDHCPVALLMAF